MDDSKTARSRSKIQMLLIVNAVLMTVLLTALYYQWNEASSVPRADESVPVPASLVAVSSDETADRAPSLAVQLEPSKKQPRPKFAATPAAATEKEVLAPETRPLPTGPIITARAWVGEPFGIGKLNILFNPDDAPHWQPDQTVFLHETSLRTRHPVIRVVKPDGAKGAAQLTELNVTFLFSGSEPLDLTLTAADAELARIESIHPSNDEAEHRQVLNAWWEKFQEDLSNATGNQYLFRSYWARMLAHRLKLQLEVPYSANKADRGTAEIERRFEHIVSALFGIDSVLLAMPDYEPRLKQVELASQPLPTPMRLRSVAIPTIPHGIDIEDIAFRAPQDCYYVRCQRVKNYLWLRDLLMQWGGSLQEVVAARTIDFDIRRTIERQLAIGAETTFTLGADRAITDLALIGSDLFFRDGTGVGALFEAKDSALLSDIINKQREERLKNDPSIQQILVQIEGHDVSLLLAPGNVVRSYYVVDGDYHLVTNSRDIATKFLQTGRAKSGLGHLREFQYARSKAVPRLQHRVWIYVSDPFFRRIVSPEYRIEVGRRAEALAKLQELRLGSLTAASEDATDTTVDALRDQGFLSTDFAIRADESQAMLVRGVAVDSLRGRPGTFKPIPDMAITRATRREVAEYNNFRHEYARQWRVMDPVVVSIASAPSNQAHRQNVSMRVMVTPYARERYSFLTNSLGPTSSRRINRLPGDLLSLEAGLRGNGQTYQAHVGLHDGRVAFRIEDGEIVRERPFEHTPFGRRNFYAVVQPSGLTGLGLIRRFAESLAASTSRGSSFDELSPEDRSPNVTASDDFLVAGLKWIVESVLLKPIKVMGSSSSIVNTGGWSVVARNHELLDTVPRQLGLGGQDRSSQIRFRMRDVNSAAVAPYVHAYSFLEARKSSAASAALLDLVTQQLNQRPEDARSVAERALRARLMCPLGGDYELAASGWRSSAWATDSYVDVKAAPADYRHPFLNWLRGLDVAFKLSPNTLVADINMEVLASGDRRRESDFIAIDQKESSAPPPHTTLKTVATQNERLRAVTDATRLQAGDTVVVIDTAATLRLGRTTLAALIAGERFRVLETLGEWVGVQREHDRLVQRAWVHQKFLGTVEQADNE